MKLTKINYCSAIFFGVLSLVVYLALGFLQLSFWDSLLATGLVAGPFNYLTTLLYAPLLGAVLGYLFAIVFISLYNFVAKKYPINLELRK